MTTCNCNGVMGKIANPEGWVSSPITNYSSLVFCLQLLKMLDSFAVVEREGQVIACAALFPFFEEKCGEVAAIAVSP
uniref:Uncharacterized protein n=2 Tax=Rhizophora mucronata TaxID=61149 RepID=A0A2P2JWT5_RHIMU